MHMILKTPWIADGMRQAQVDDRNEVRYVMPAAMRPPGGQL
jgi:hypothetical protein